MIIKYTFNDNDFTQIIEKYLDEFGPFARWVLGSNVDKIYELKTQYDNHNDKYMEEKLDKGQYINLKKKLVIELKKHFKAYIESIQPNSMWHTDGFTALSLVQDKEYILDNIKISLVKSIPDQWENGEVVYFITSNLKYITM